MNSTRFIGWLLLASGLVALIISVIDGHAPRAQILVFTGLALTLWGPLLLYVSQERYVKQTLLDSTIISSLVDLDQIVAELGYQGKGVYLPPEYFKDFETSKIFVPRNKYAILPPPEEIQRQEDRVFLKSPEAMLIDPPGLSLSRLFEKTLGTSFTKVDLAYLKQNLPKLFIEELEIAEDLEMHARSDVNTKNNTIQVKIVDSAYDSLCRESKKLSHIHGAIGCPIWSAIACALTKATGRPVMIENTYDSVEGKTIEADFRVLGSFESKEAIETLLAEEIESQISRVRVKLLLNLASFLMIGVGSLMLAFISWLTWYDMTVWNKGLAEIFLGSRTGEAISLGIGMRVIYYFLVSLILFLTGLIIILRRREWKV